MVRWVVKRIRRMLWMARRESEDRLEESGKWRPCEETRSEEEGNALEGSNGTDRNGTKANEG
jgi:hypothetical protein